jgi:PAS domain S-box-containing protein
MQFKRILIVDDDANLRRTVSDILEAKGYVPVIAATGRAAVESVRETAPAVALLDLRMEDLSGIKVLRRIRERSPRTECIVLTGHASQESAIEAVNLGAYGYLQKPYDVNQLLVTIQRAIERQEDRQALQASEERYRRFFETSRDCAFITSREGRWLDMNQTAVELFGYDSQEELEKVNVHDLYAQPADREVLLQTIEEQGAVQNYAVDLQKRDGDVVHALITCVPLRDKQGRIGSLQGTIRDITEQKEAEEALATYAVELAEKNAELERLNEQKNQFLGIAAHELRNPLHFILTYSEFLLEEASDVLTEEQVKFLSIIRSSSEFMVRLVNDLLDVARINAGRLQLNTEPTDLVALVRRSVSLNRTLAAKRDVDLRLQEDPLPTLAVDPVKIEQVLNNLMTNAVKYSPPGSVVNLTLSRDGDYVTLAVRDRGPGIPDDELDRVFQPFETTSIESLTGEKGTGLGLVIAKKIAQGHGGNIWVESAVGQGTTFYLSLPIHDEGDGQPGR